MNITEWSVVLFQKIWFLFVVFSITFHETKGSLVNMAYMRPTLRGGHGDGEYAVNGRNDSCMDPTVNSDPYWVVDLGSPYMVHHIRAYNCNDNCGGVKASESSDNKTYSLFDDQAVMVDTYFKFEPARPMKGRWVKLWKVLSGDLSFCEVDVMVHDRESFNMLHRQETKNNGWVLKRIQVVSVLQCAYHCLNYEMCYGANIIDEMTSSPEMKCQLLGPKHVLLVDDTSATYLEMRYD